MQLERKAIYSAHEILLAVIFNTGNRVVESETVLTHTLQSFIDSVPFLEKTDLTDDELISSISEVEIQAKRRIDIIGTPEDSPLVVLLMEMGFTIA